MLVLLLGLLLSACSGGSFTVSEDDSAVAPAPAPAPDSRCAQDFAEWVQPRLEYCRTCHVPEGVGDVEEGDDFLLSQAAEEDLDNLRQSWERLGGNNPVSRILRMAAGTDTRSHTGGEPWPPGSEAYAAVEDFLHRLETDASCQGAAKAAPAVAESADLTSF